MLIMSRIGTSFMIGCMLMLVACGGEQKSTSIGNNLAEDALKNDGGLHTANPYPDNDEMPPLKILAVSHWGAARQGSHMNPWKGNQAANFVNFIELTMGLTQDYIDQDATVCDYLVGGSAYAIPAALQEMSPDFAYDFSRPEWKSFAISTCLGGVRESAPVRLRFTSVLYGEMLVVVVDNLGFPYQVITHPRTIGEVGELGGDSSVQF